MARRMVTIDGNEAAAYVAHRTNEVIAIYPITPSSGMGELSDEYSARGQKNIWGTVPSVIEMQSEGGAAGAVHGSLQAGSLTPTFTSSQGLLLMIPNMYKIAGELTSAVFHIAARALATHALSIFGDHSDVMATRSTGWGMLFGNNVQEVMDFACIAQAASLEARVPFMHIFDGFRTSHEVQKIELLDDLVLLTMMDEKLIRAHRERGLTPDRPVLRGSAQNPDVFFQAREAANGYYTGAPRIVQNVMDKFAALTGRAYKLFDYCGAPDAERVIIMMGSGCETAEETVAFMNARHNEKVGLLKVRLYRPLDASALIGALPKSVRSIAVLDRCKEPGAAGEPLYMDVVTALAESAEEWRLPFVTMPRVTGGRYGLSSKEFTPAMVKGVFDNLVSPSPKKHFTVGIHDDVTRLSLDCPRTYSIGADDVVRAVFWGLGADGTVSANKNSIKIIGEDTPNFAQGYFVYDSKKAGAVTISHLRFGPRPIKSTFLITRANFVAVHQFGFLRRYNVLDLADTGAVLLLNAPFPAGEVWDNLPRPIQQQIIAKKLKLYAIDAYDVAKRTGMGVRINTIMQTCFFAISGVLPREEAIERIKGAIKKTYGKRGEAVVKKNYDAVDATISHLSQIEIPAEAAGRIELIPAVPENAPAFVRDVTGRIVAGLGDQLPVSAMPVDGTFPTGTTKWEKRGIALEVPVWETDLCIECGKCVLVCPHACIRAKAYDAKHLENAPATFKHMPAKWTELKDRKYSIQVSTEDCTGCRLCVEVCPAKDKSNVSRKALNMADVKPIVESERTNWDFFLNLPEMKLSGGELKYNNVKDVQLLRPLFEFSGACAGCGETPYLKLLSQLFGDRAVIANATGCSSIYGGNLPTTPWTKNAEGRGPAWSNSLFEDNAEFGLGMRLAIDRQSDYARELVKRYSAILGDELTAGLLENRQANDQEIEQQRIRVAHLKEKLKGLDEPAARDLLGMSDALVKRSVWIVGGDGWAYDIDFGGLDHVLACGLNVNILVLDTEVYSNTGGQASKATPIGAVAKFASAGKLRPKKDLGAMAIAYGSVYVASVAMGAKDVQTVLAFQEAESYDGPSLIIAYSHCIAHGIDISKGLDQQRLAVASGQWPLYRFDPRQADRGAHPMKLDYAEPKIPVRNYLANEARFAMLGKSNPEAMERFVTLSQEGAQQRWKKYSALASLKPSEEK